MPPERKILLATLFYLSLSAPLLALPMFGEGAEKSTHAQSAAALAADQRGKADALSGCASSFAPQANRDGSAAASIAEVAIDNAESHRQFVDRGDRNDGMNIGGKLPSLSAAEDSGTRVEAVSSRAIGQLGDVSVCEVPPLSNRRIPAFIPSQEEYQSRNPLQKGESYYEEKINQLIQRDYYENIKIEDEGFKIKIFTLLNHAKRALVQAREIKAGLAESFSADESSQERPASLFGLLSNFCVPQKTALPPNIQLAMRECSAAAADWEKVASLTIQAKIESQKINNPYQSYFDLKPKIYEKRALFRSLRALALTKDREDIAVACQKSIQQTIDFEQQIKQTAKSERSTLDTISFISLPTLQSTYEELNLQMNQPQLSPSATLEDAITPHDITVEGNSLKPQF